MRWCFLLLLLTGLGTFCVFHACAAPSSRLLMSSPSSQPSPAPLCAGAVACTLEQIQIGPIQFCIDIPIANTTEIFGLCVQDFVCDNIVFSALESAYVSPHTIQVAIDNLEINCFGEWNVTETDTDINVTSLLYAGEFSLDIDTLTAAAAMDFANYSSYYALPQALILINCSVPSANFEVHFLGGIIGKTLDQTLAPKLEAGLEDYVDELFCGVLGEVLSTGLSTLILESSSRREAIIEAGRSNYPPPIVNGTFDWRTSKLASLHSLLGSLSLNSAGGTEGGDMTKCLLNSSALDVLRPPSGDDDSDLLINKLLDLLTNDTGEIRVPLNIAIPLGNTSSTLQIESLVLIGLDTFTNLSLLVPSAYSGVVLSSSIGMEELKLQVFMQLNASSSYVEAMVVTLDLSHVLLALDLVVALSEDTLASIYVDQFLNDSNCLALALEELSVSSLTLAVTIAEVSLTQISGDATSLEEDVMQLVDNMLEWLLASWPVTDLLAGLGQTVIKDHINVNLEERRNTLQAHALLSCPEHVEASGVEYMDWNTSAKIRQLNDVLNTAIGVEGLNSLMACVTGGTGELTVFKNDSNASLTLSGLTSFYEFALLYPLPSEPYNLGSRISVGHCDGSSGCTPFGLTLRAQVGQKQIFLDMEMQNLELFLDLLFMLNKMTVLNLNLLQMQSQGCVMTATESLLIQASSLHLTDAELYLDDGESDPVNITHAVETILTHFEEIGGVEGKLNEMLAHVTETAADRCAGTYDPSADDEASASKTDTSVGDWSWQIAVALVSLLLLAIFSYYHCGPEASSFDTNFKSSNNIRNISVSNNKDVIISPSFTPGNDMSEKLLSCNVRNSDPSVTSRTSMENQINQPKEFVMYLLKRLGYDEDACARYDALFASEMLPVWLRVCFPVAIFCCMGIVTASNVLTIASVMVEVNVGEAVSITPDSLLDFSLGQTVHDMWHAKAYLLAVLLCLLSGSLPYIKLWGMLIAWMAPSSAVTLSWRGWALEWLDIVGKWSLLDCYIMVLMMVAFSVELELGRDITAIVTVVPLSGFNLFLLALLINLLLGHVCCNCHRLATDGEFSTDGQDNNALDISTEAMKDHIFRWRYVQKKMLPQAKEEFNNSLPTTISTSSTSIITLPYERFEFTSLGKTVITVLLVGCMFMVIASVFLLTFVFHFRGLVGYILGDAADNSYSVVSTGITVPPASGNPNSFIVRWIQVCFFGFGVVMPLLFLFLMLIMWVIPLRLSTYRKFVIFAEVSNAWSALDVLMVSIFAALFELQEFAAFMIGDVCDDLNNILKQCCDEQLHGDDICFDVKASLLPLFGVLAATSGLLCLGGLSILQIAQHAMRERRLELLQLQGKGVDAGDDTGALFSVDTTDHGEGRVFDKPDRGRRDGTSTPPPSHATTSVDPPPRYHTYADLLCAYFVNISLALKLVAIYCE